MAIGDNNNNNNSGKTYENTYYSRLRIKNADSKLALAPTFRSGLLNLEISELKEGFKYESLIGIFLSPTKARLLANEILKFKKYLNSEEIVPGKAFGVNAGMNDKVSYIGFHANEKRVPLVTIGKIDGSGNITEQVTIELNVDYHFALEWENINTMDVVKAYDNNVEIDQLYELVYDFGRSMSGASAYSTIDLGRFDHSRILRKMDPIYDKLGIERLNSGNGGSNYNRGNSFLDNSKSINSNHTSFDSMEGLFDGE